jgi:hypothetical protein
MSIAVAKEMLRRTGTCNFFFFRVARPDCVDGARLQEKYISINVFFMIHFAWNHSFHISKKFRYFLRYSKEFFMGFSNWCWEQGDRNHIAGAMLGLGLALNAGVAFAAPDVTVTYTPLQPSPAFSVSISADGRYLAYRLKALDGKGGSTINAYDVGTGISTQANLTASGGAPTNAKCDAPSISANGRYIIFGCDTAAMGGAANGAVVVNKDVASLHAASFTNSGSARSGLSQTSSFNFQSLVAPDQRSGQRCLAAS